MTEVVAVHLTSNQNSYADIVYEDGHHYYMAHDSYLALVDYILDIHGYKSGVVEVDYPIGWTPARDASGEPQIWDEAVRGARRNAVADGSDGARGVREVVVLREVGLVARTVIEEIAVEGAACLQ